MPGPDGVMCPLGTQISFVGATMPRDLENILADVVPVIAFLMFLICKRFSCRRETVKHSVLFQKFSKNLYYIW